jgi:hypothetical protein
VIASGNWKRETETYAFVLWLAVPLIEDYNVPKMPCSLLNFNEKYEKNAHNQ